MGNAIYKHQITTSDGKIHEVSKSNIDKHGMAAYASAYKGATVRMRDDAGGDYDIPLEHYDKAQAEGLRLFTITYGGETKPTRAVSEPEAPAQNPKGVASGQNDNPVLQEKASHSVEPAWLRRAKIGKQIGEAVDFAKGLDSQIERTRRVAERGTQKVRDRVKAGEFMARMSGTPTRVAGLTPARMDLSYGVPGEGERHCAGPIAGGGERSEPGTIRSGEGERKAQDSMALARRHVDHRLLGG